MLTTLQSMMHRAAAGRFLREAAYLASDRQLREELGAHRKRLSRRAIREGWSPRTTAAILAAIWIAGHAIRLDPERRRRIAETIMQQERAGLDALRWLEDYHGGCLNTVGIDVQLMRFNHARGTIEAWIAEREAVDPHVRRIFLAMAAWSLSDMPAAEIETRFADLLDDLGVGTRRHPEVA